MAQRIRISGAVLSWLATRIDAPKRHNGQRPSTRILLRRCRPRASPDLGHKTRLIFGLFPLQFIDLRLSLRDHTGDLCLRIAAVNMLGTIHVPGGDLKQDSPLGRDRILRVSQLFDKITIPFNDARLTPESNATTVSVIHQEDEGQRILGQVAQRDVLPIAAEVGECLSQEKMNCDESGE